MVSKNIFNTRSIPMTSSDHKSAGILDDYATRKDIQTISINSQIQTGFNLIGDISGGNLYRCREMADPINDGDYVNLSYANVLANTAVVAFQLVEMGLSSLSGAVYNLSGTNTAEHTTINNNFGMLSGAFWTLSGANASQHAVISGLVISLSGAFYNLSGSANSKFNDYLLLSGSNANQTLNIGFRDFITTGSISGGLIKSPLISGTSIYGGSIYCTYTGGYYGISIRNTDNTSYSALTMYDNRNDNNYVSQWGLYGTNTGASSGACFFYNTAGRGIGFYVGSGAVPGNDLRADFNSADVKTYKLFYPNYDVSTGGIVEKLRLCYANAVDAGGSIVWSAGASTPTAKIDHQLAGGAADGFLRFWTWNGSAMTEKVRIDGTGNLIVSGAGVFKKNGSPGVGGSFTTVDLKTVTVSGGIIISIV